MVDRFRRGAVFVLAMLTSSLLLVPSSFADSFLDELNYLKEQNPQIVGRDSQIVLYEQLLKDHPNHPDRATAMLLIADLWQMSDPTNGVERDVEKELDWVRRARTASEIGSPTWFDAGFRLEGEIFRKSPAEAEQILNEISDHSTGAIVDTKILYKRQEMALYAKDYSKAEDFCRKLVGWNTDSPDMPAEILGKGEVFEWMQNGASTMMIAWAEMDAPTSVRRKKIESLYEDFQGKAYMEQYRDAALEHLEKLPIEGDSVHILEQPKGSGRNWLIWLNVVALALFLVYGFSTRRARKTA